MTGENPSIATLRFEISGNTRTLRQLLWNLQGRATVQGRITVTIDGVLQDWWEREQDDREEDYRRYREERRQDEAREARITAEILRDPSRSDEEIAAVMGCPASWIPARREKARWRARWASLGEPES